MTDHSKEALDLIQQSFVMKGREVERITDNVLIVTLANSKSRIVIQQSLKLNIEYITGHSIPNFEEHILDAFTNNEIFTAQKKGRDVQICVKNKFGKN